jgi:hypothetical protein
MLTLADADRRGTVEIAERDYLMNAQFTIYGVDSSTGVDLPIGSRAGDDPVGYAEGIDEIPDGLMMTQTQANTWSGNMRAKLNNPYPDAAIPMSGAWRISPTPQSIITWTPDTGDLKRVPTGWTSKRLIVRRATYTFPDGMDTMLATFDCEPEATGPDGVSVSFASQAKLTQSKQRIGLRKAALSPSLAGITAINLPAQPGTGGIVYYVDAGGVFRTDDITVASPTWTKIITPDFAITDAALDPFNVKDGLMITQNGVTDGGIYRTSNLSSASPVVSRVYPRSALPGTSTSIGRAVMTLQVAGKSYFTCQGNDGTSVSEVWLGKSADYGASITWFKMSSATPEPAQSERQGGNAGGALFVSQRTPGLVIYAGARGGGGTTQIYVSGDDLATMAWVSNITDTNPAQFFVPYAGNDTEAIGYAITKNKVSKTTNTGTSFSDVTPAGIGITVYGLYYWLVGSKTSAANLWITDFDSNVFKSTNSGGTWTNTATLSGGNHNVVLHVHPLGFMYAGLTGNTAVSHCLQMSIDGGTTWLNKNGNINDILGSATPVAMWAV